MEGMDETKTEGINVLKNKGIKNVLFEFYQNCSYPLLFEKCVIYLDSWTIIGWNERVLSLILPYNLDQLVRPLKSLLNKRIFGEITTSNLT